MVRWILVRSKSGKKLYRSEQDHDRRKIRSVFPDHKVSVYENGEVLFERPKRPNQRNKVKVFTCVALVSIGFAYLLGTSSAQDVEPIQSLHKPAINLQSVSKGGVKLKNDRSRKRNHLSSDPNAKRLFLEGYVMEETYPQKAMEKYLLVIHLARSNPNEAYAKKAAKRLLALKRKRQLLRK